MGQRGHTCHDYGGVGNACQRLSRSLNGQVAQVDCVLQEPRPVTGMGWSVRKTLAALVRTEVQSLQSESVQPLATFLEER